MTWAGRIIAVTLCLASCLAACASTHSPSRSRSSTTAVTGAPAATQSALAASNAPVVRRPSVRLVVILPGARRHGLLGWTPAAAVRGRGAAWITRLQAHQEPGFTVTLLRFDQRLVRLALHAGSEDPGGTGWRYGPAIGRAEGRTLIAAFNSAFRPSYGAGGFLQDGRVGWRLLRRAASVVIYHDGTADIGVWGRAFPTPGRRVAEVRQNLSLLIDHGRAPPSVDTCIKLCWGDPRHEQPDVARSALGVTADAQLLWAAGNKLSVRALADALIAAGAVRAMELDINPAWVAGYVYAHRPHAARLAPIALVPGQAQIPGEFLAPYYRDFFSVLARALP